MSILSKVVLLTYVMVIGISSDCYQKRSNDFNMVGQQASIRTSLPDNQVQSEMSEYDDFFGIWTLERIVLKSKAYDGTSKEALAGIDEEDYIDLELEILPESFRLGENIYKKPVYHIEYKTCEEYNNGGNYILPDFYGFLNEEDIIIENADQYTETSLVPLKYLEVAFEEEYFIPVGRQCVLLNSDTMLVGIWGKIILAHKVSIKE